MFGYCLLRIIHYIAALRYQYPRQPILIQKVDWKSAYKRIHLHHDTAIQCCSTYTTTSLSFHFKASLVGHHAQASGA